MQQSPGESSTLPSAGPATRTAAGGRWTVRRVLVVATMAIGFGLCALVAGAAIGVSTGLLAFVIGLMFAVVPVGIVVPSLVWVDRFEHEPVRRLLLAFCYGGTVAAAVSLLLNTGSMALMTGLTSDDAMAVAAVAVAPLVEETTKGLGLALLWGLDRDEMDGLVDGLVYGGIIAAGFAFTENILYLGRAYAEFGGAGLFGTLVLRGLVGPFAHPLFTGCTGIGVGIAIGTGRAWLRVAAPVLGWAAGIGLHALWNAAAVAGANGFLTTFALTQLPIFAGYVWLALWARAREGRVIGTTLAGYAACGWFTPAEVAMVSSLAGRQRALAWARAVGGTEARRAMERFQDEATTLALLRARIDSRGAAPGEHTREQALLQRVAELRPVALAVHRWLPPPPAPVPVTPPSIGRAGGPSGSPH